MVDTVRKMRWVPLLALVACTSGCQALANLFGSFTGDDPAALAGEGLMDLVTGDTVGGGTKLIVAGSLAVLGFLGYKGRKLPGAILRRRRQYRQGQEILRATERPATNG